MPHNTPISVAQAQEVTHDMQTLGKALAEHGKKVDRFIMLVRFLIVAVVIAGGVGCVGLYAADRARRAVNINEVAIERLDAIVGEIEASRSEARTSACVRDNVDTFNDRATLIDSLLELVDPGVELTPAQQAKLDRYTAKVIERQPYRDCSPAGIDAWYEHPPRDPATP